MRICGIGSTPMTLSFAAIVSTTTRFTRDENGSSTQDRRLKTYIKSPQLPHPGLSVGESYSRTAGNKRGHSAPLSASCHKSEKNHPHPHDESLHTGKSKEAPCKRLSTSHIFNQADIAFSKMSAFFTFLYFQFFMDHGNMFI